MSGLEVAGAVLSVVQLTLDIADFTALVAFSAFSLVEIYGLAGLALYLFGNRSTWRLEAQVLGKLDDEEAIAFKDSVQGQCTMISVAAAIVAQISITAISLSNLSQTHWVAAGFLNLSLISALMAVYYSTTQYRILGRLLQAKQIRLWIRGGRRNQYPSDRIVPSVWQLIDNWKKRNQISTNDAVLQDQRSGLPMTIQQIRSYPRLDTVSIFGLMKILAYQGPAALFTHAEENIHPACDPSSFKPAGTDPAKLGAKLRSTCFTPSVSAVVTMSAPQALLTISLFSLLISLGIYLGFTWTRDLNDRAGENDSRNIFIMFVSSLGVCLLVYTLSLLIQDEDPRREMSILNQYVADYVQNDENKPVVDGWGYEWEIKNGVLLFSHRQNSVTTPGGDHQDDGTGRNSIAGHGYEMSERGGIEDTNAGIV